MDLTERVTFIFLIALAIIAVVLFFRQYRVAISARMKGKVVKMTFKDALTFTLVCPALLTGSIGALWICFESRQDLPRVLSLCVSFGLLMGVISALAIYQLNRASLRVMNTNSS